MRHREYLPDVTCAGREAIIDSTVVAISGSLRRRSYNTALLHHAAGVAPHGMQIELADISAFPLYNSDIREESGFPEPVAKLRHQILAADGVLFASPEYNRSVTGALKNAIDWLSVGADAPLSRKPAAVLGVGGRLGTVQSQSALRDILAHLDVNVIHRPEVLVVNGWSHFDDDLALTDQRTADQVRRLLFALDGQIRLDRSRPRAIVLAASDDLLSTLPRHLGEAGYTVSGTGDAAWALSELQAGGLALLVAEPGLGDDSELAALAGAAATNVVMADDSAAFHDLLDALRRQ